MAEEKTSEWWCLECAEPVSGELQPGDRCSKDDSILIRRRALPFKRRAEKLGQMVGGCALFDVVGAGGMGAVYRGVQEGVRRPVAVKTIKPQIEEQPDMLKRFRYEARILGRIDHPGVVRLHHFGEHEDGSLYMVLELVEGRPLSRLLAATKRLHPEHAVAIAQQVLEALEAPHSLGLIHRDVKPSNIMLEGPEGSETVKLIDFGVARTWDEPEDTCAPHTNAGLLVGTPGYMAPELLAAGEIGPWSDQYAVGVLLYRMLAGQAPFRGTPAMVWAKHLQEAVPALPRDVPPALDAVVRKAMAKEHSERFASAAQMAAALDEALQTPEPARTVLLRPPLPPPPAPLPPVERSYSPPRWSLALVAALLLLNLGILVLSGEHSSPLDQPTAKPRPTEPARPRAPKRPIKLAGDPSSSEVSASTSALGHSSTTRR